VLYSVAGSSYPEGGHVNPIKRIRAQIFPKTYTCLKAAAQPPYTFCFAPLMHSAAYNLAHEYAYNCHSSFIAALRQKEIGDHDSPQRGLDLGTPEGALHIEHSLSLRQLRTGSESSFVRYNEHFQQLVFSQHL
jgi:hypothetical protein